jgi:hypothetical protein
MVVFAVGLVGTLSHSSPSARYLKFRCLLRYHFSVSLPGRRHFHPMRVCKSNNHVTFPLLRAATDCLQLHSADSLNFTERGLQ